MHVIGRSVDQNDVAAKLANDATHVGKQARLQFRIQQRSTVFGAENDVRQQVGEGVGHVFFRPSGAWFVLRFTHGLRRGLNSFAAPQLQTALPRFTQTNSFTEAARV